MDGFPKHNPFTWLKGEKDADNLLTHGLVASTAPVTIKWHEEYTQALKDADVVILYDNDKAGLQRRDLIVNNLYGKVKKLRVVDLPGIEYSESHGKDVSDWLAMGNTIAQLLEIVGTYTRICSLQWSLNDNKGRAAAKYQWKSFSLKTTSKRNVTCSISYRAKDLF